MSRLYAQSGAIKGIYIFVMAMALPGTAFYNV